ncbi:MAG: 3-ketoacyl-ACP reductase [Phycisphaerales bacterium]|nr:3-ketoacyl-ACP reductase [Phycisphaerales bacterium]
MHDKPVALVTGSARGIGRGIAIRLAREGFTVAINGVTVDPGDTTQGAYEVKTSIELAGGQADVFPADISSVEQRQAMIDAIEKRWGRIDLLVNNAGVAPKVRLDILESTEDSFERVININLQGPYFLTQLVANKMIAWKQVGKIPNPRILFVTSISAYTSSPSRGEYCVSKAGLSMVAKLFAHRLGEYGIPVLEVCPGIIKTRMTAGVTDKYDKLIAEGLLIDKRWGQPEDVAGVVSAFARGNLDYSTGERIEVGGGFGVRRL